MIRALAPDRADQAFNIPILPGRVVRRGPVPDPHCSHTSLECNTECSVVVANEIFWCAVPGKRFGDLVRQPLGRRIAGHREPQQPPPLVPENQKCEKLLERNRRNHKQFRPPEATTRTNVRFHSQKPCSFVYGSKCSFCTKSR